MNDFSYYNIFETKGIEYLLTILFFALLIPFWIVLNRKVKIRVAADEQRGILSIANLTAPAGIFFGKNHAWAYLEKTGFAKIGINDLLARLTGDVQINYAVSPGEPIAKGDLLVELTKGTKRLNIYSPITGIVVNANEALHEDSTALRHDPYEQGWLMEVKPEKWKEETQGYYLADKAINWLAGELDRFKHLLNTAIQRDWKPEGEFVLQDGGELLDQPLSEMPEEFWNEFQKEFLNNFGRY